jgi:hypothetical protein
MSEVFAPSLKTSSYVAQVPEAYGRMDVSSVFCQADVFRKRFKIADKLAEIFSLGGLLGLDVCCSQGTERA